MAAAYDDGSRLYVLAKAAGASGQVLASFAQTTTTGPFWSPWQGIGGVTNVAPAATLCYEGMTAFIRQMDGTIAMASLGPLVGATWSGWTTIPGITTNIAPAATCTPSDSRGLHVYAVDPSGNVWENVRTGYGGSASPFTWTGWRELPANQWHTRICAHVRLGQPLPNPPCHDVLKPFPQIVDAVAAVPVANGNIMLLARDSSAGGIYERTLTFADQLTAVNGTWDVAWNLTNLSGATIGAPAAAYVPFDTDGHPKVYAFAHDASGNPWYDVLDVSSGTWAGNDWWTQLTGSVTTSLAASFVQQTKLWRGRRVRARRRPERRPRLLDALPQGREPACRADGEGDQRACRRGRTTRRGTQRSSRRAARRTRST